MTAEEIASRLQDAHRTSNGWEARCPAHEDRNASLGIAEGRDGRVLLNCHAGCTFPEIVAALGVKPADLFPPKPEGKGRKRGRIVATYDYTDPAGKLLFQVVRFDPKDFRQRRPDPNKPGRWTWNLNGQARVLYRLPDVIRAKTEGRAVFLAEGEKDCDALAALGLCATCNPGGAVSRERRTGKLAKWEDSFTETLTKTKVIVLPDRDGPGRRHAALVTWVLTNKAESVRVVELPDRDGRTVKDAADWIAAGGTVEELREIVRTAPAWEPPPEESEEQAAAPSVTAETNGKPAVLLPHGAQSISDTGHTLGELLARTQRFFIRGGAVAKLSQDKDGLPLLDEVKPASLASDFESVARLLKIEKVDGQPTPVRATCAEQTAKVIAASAAFREAMPPIVVLTRCPVQIERAGGLVEVCGYDRASGILAAGRPVERMDVAEARRLLCEVLDGFRFATSADRARALAAMVTPALVFGDLLRGRAPVDLGEADASQTGKGYRNKLTAALYAQSVKTVAQQRGGVGSMEESFDMALIRGANFIALDNVRGRIDSQKIESFLTEDTYHARGFHCEADIDPRRVCVMFTSNKAEFTDDFSNRTSCVRLLKQPEGYAFAPYPEGDILGHVRANQARYLGAVFAIVKAWYDAGRPLTTETRHTFRQWAQTLDWITRNLLDAGPLLDGHRETQARMTNPVLNWLRDVALEVIQARQTGAWLRTGDLVDLIAETGIETPGLPEHGDLTDHDTRKAAQQATGRKLGLCFRAGNVVDLDGMKIERRETCDEGRHPLKEYRFLSAAMEFVPIAANPAAHPKTTPETPGELAIEPPKEESCRYSASIRAADDDAIKPIISAYAADVSRIGQTFSTSWDSERGNILSMGTISGIAATEDEINAEMDLAAVEIEEGEIR